MKKLTSTILLLLLVSVEAFGQAKGGGGGSSGGKHFFGTGIMFLNSETKQGGAGPTGSTLLSQTDFIRMWKKLGYGITFNYDKHGKNQTDSSYGLKLEYHIDIFYLEFGYLMKATRAYTDRSIAEETGSGMLYGFGARFPIGRGGKGGGSFFHASYKVKTQTLKQQDGVDITEPITQTDGYPLFGFGYNF